MAALALNVSWTNWDVLYIYVVIHFWIIYCRTFWLAFQKLSGKLYRIRSRPSLPCEEYPSKRWGKKRQNNTAFGVSNLQDSALQIFNFSLKKKKIRLLVYPKQSGFTDLAAQKLNFIHHFAHWFDLIRAEMLSLHFFLFLSYRPVQSMGKEWIQSAV